MSHLLRHSADASDQRRRAIYPQMTPITQKNVAISEQRTLNDEP